jgi:hypothetical protein
MTDRNGVQFIGTNATMEEFLSACPGIEGPLVTAFHDRHREGPILVTNEKECAVSGFRIYGNALLLVSLGNEISGVLSILREFAAEHDVLAARTKDSNERGNVKLICCVDQGVRSLLWTCEALASRSRWNGRSGRFCRRGLLR